MMTTHVNNRRNGVNLIICIVVFYILFRYTFDRNHYDQEQQLPIIIIPGGGLTPEGNLPDYVMARMDKAIELYKNSMTSPSSCGVGPCIITLSAGTTHAPPPLDAKGFPSYESSVGVQYLLRAGVPARNILEEKLSLDTLGNAYFLRTIHTDPNAWTELIIITNRWHMARVEAIFTTIFNLPMASSTLQSTGTGTGIGIDSKYHLKFESVDDILSPSILLLRENREKTSLSHFTSKTVPLLHSLSDVHHFLFWKHSAYSSQRLTDEGQHVVEIIDPELLKSY